MDEFWTGSSPTFTPRKLDDRFAIRILLGLYLVFLWILLGTSQEFSRTGGLPPRSPTFSLILGINLAFKYDFTRVLLGEAPMASWLAS